MNQYASDTSQSVNMLAHSWREKSYATAHRPLSILLYDFYSYSINLWLEFTQKNNLLALVQTYNIPNL